MGSRGRRAGDPGRTAAEGCHLLSARARAGLGGLLIDEPLRVVECGFMFFLSDNPTSRNPNFFLWLPVIAGVSEYSWPCKVLQKLHCGNSTPLHSEVRPVTAQDVGARCCRDDHRSLVPRRGGSVFVQPLSVYGSLVSPYYRAIH